MTSTLISSRKPCCKTCAIGLASQAAKFLHLVQCLNPPEPGLQFLNTGGTFHPGLNISGGKKKERKRKSMGKFQLVLTSGMVIEILKIRRLPISILPTQFQEWRRDGNKLCLLTSQGTNACCFPMWSALTCTLLSHSL